MVSRFISIKEEETMQNKYKIMSDIFARESLSIDKYEPNKVANGLNHATFFVVSNDIDVTDL